MENHSLDKQSRVPSRQEQAIISQALNAAMLLDAKGNIAQINDAAEQFFGYSDQELTGKRFELLFPNRRSRSTQRAYFDKLLARNKNNSIQLTAQKRDGSAITARLEMKQLKGGAFIVLLVYDLTALQQDEASLRQSEVRYRRLFESAQDGILILEADTGNIIDINPYLAQKLGHTHEYFLGKQLWELGLFKDAEECKAAFHELQEKGYVRYENLPLQSSHGQPLDVEFVSNVYSVNDNNVIQCNIRDISGRRKTELQQKNDFALLRQKARALEHYDEASRRELNDEQGCIIGLSQLIRQNSFNELSKNSVEFLEFILQSSTHTRALLAGLLEYSQVVSHEVVKATVDCEAILSSIMLEMRDTIFRRDAQITHTPLPVINGASAEIHLLLSHLISNAIKFQPGERPRVDISACREGAVWEFYVHDQGIGILSKYQQRIFQMFERLHNTDKFPGAGIGLTVCDMIVGRHGGKLWVESEPTLGSTFYFTLKAD